MKYIVIIFFVLAIIYQFFNLKKPQVSTITINQTSFEIEIADNDAKREKGLSGRDSLGENNGMLFIFPKKGYYNFWMNEMKIPLDFVWIEGSKVVDLAENVPAPKDKTNLKLFTSRNPADKVLEINTGSIKKNMIKIGDTVQISKVSS